ncbi:phenylpropionate dioxygenase-like ring-hydroxylating dioxygenase large terminal subunit [Humitalea rosea]|uniref:Phenylpropionate dioxygenase-like ring-hydroxylating dioxygenase large terminal subunit n=2 Tax=Humitalea rosea TaxID=990373 RepID=A0A2W7IMY3_9PROT|nr:phenylpropionate dioxygenase-like ring-hydroxylating dioxygenase large terminal subunit [Humitalea rosea]
MRVTQTPLLTQFWYPVIPVSLLEGGPRAFRLLGRDIVVWRDGEGRAAALDDRCCHRTAKLSKGFYSNGVLACGYHGWEFDRDGTVVRVPQRPVDRQGRTNMSVPGYRAEIRYGYVWVALAEPLYPIPDFEEEAEGFRHIDEFYESWSCAGLRVMENSFDNAHFAFVHRASFGDQGHPEPAKVEIDEFADGFTFRSEVPVRNPEAQKVLLNMDSDTTVRSMNARWYAPFLRKLRITYPNGLVHSIVTAATPIDDQHSMICQWVYRNDTEADAPAQKVIDFDRVVTGEDREILESTDWDVPLDQAGREMNMPSDKPGVMMRRILARMIADADIVRAVE